MALLMLEGTKEFGLHADPDGSVLYFLTDGEGKLCP